MTFKFESAPKQEGTKQESQAEDVEKEVGEIDSEKKKAERLIELRQKKIELKKLIEILNESILVEPGKEGEQDKGKVNAAETAFYIKTKILPEMVEWTLQREKEGKDVDFYGFLEERDVPDLDLDIIVHEIERYESNEPPQTLGQEAMLKKTQASERIRTKAHKILAEIGEIDPFLKKIKTRQLEAEFIQWFDRFVERVQTKAELWASGYGALEGIFTKFWDRQGMIDKAFSKFNKKRMGLIEHTFMLKGISSQIEKVADLIEKSDDAKEVRHLTGELKNMTRTLVEWNNEYQRLHKIGEDRSGLNGHIDAAYTSIREDADLLDQMVIEELYTNKKGERGFEGNTEILKRKRNLCDILLSELKKHKAVFSQELDERQRHLHVINRESTKDKVYKIEKAAGQVRAFYSLINLVEEIKKTSNSQKAPELFDKFQSLLQNVSFESPIIRNLEKLLLDWDVGPENMLELDPSSELEKRKICARIAADIREHFGDIETLADGARETMYYYHYPSDNPEDENSQAKKVLKREELFNDLLNLVNLIESTNNVGELSVEVARLKALLRKEVGLDSEGIEELNSIIKNSKESEARVA